MGGGLRTMFNVFAQGAYISPYGNTMNMGTGYYGYGGPSYYQGGHHPDTHGHHSHSGMFNFLGSQGYGYPVSTYANTMNTGHGGYYPKDPRMSQYGMPLNSDGSPVSSVQRDYERWKHQGEEIIHEVTGMHDNHGAHHYGGSHISNHHHGHHVHSHDLHHDPRFIGYAVPGMPGYPPGFDPRFAGQMPPGGGMAMPPAGYGGPMGGNPGMAGNAGREEAPPPIHKNSITDGNYRSFAEIMTPGDEVDLQGRAAVSSSPASRVPGPKR